MTEINFVVRVLGPEVFSWMAMAQARQHLLISNLPPTAVHFTAALGASAPAPHGLLSVGWPAEARKHLAAVRTLPTGHGEPQNRNREPSNNTANNASQ